MVIVSGVFSSGKRLVHELGFSYTEFEEASGATWSELQRKHTGESAAVVSDSGEVLCLAFDFSAAVPANGLVIAMSDEEYGSVAALSDPVFINGSFVERPQEEGAAEAATRYQRDALVRETDWMVLPDSPLSAGDHEKVLTYRQALRDVPAQPGFPLDVLWPVLDVQHYA